MAKLYFDLDEQYVTRIQTYFPEDLIQYVFVDFLDSASTLSFVCSVLAGPCSAFVPDHNPATCQADLNALPISEGAGYIYGNTRGCRILHAGFAATNPEGHCAHVSLSTSDLDNSGDNKCSVSEQVQVSSLFSENDLNFFNDFASAQGVGPGVSVITPVQDIAEPGFFESIFDTVSGTFGLLFDLFFGGFFN